MAAHMGKNPHLPLSLVGDGGPAPHFAPPTHQKLPVIRAIIDGTFLLGGAPSNAADRIQGSLFSLLFCH
jgi:hypothetical protein